MEDQAQAKNITDRLILGGHIFDVDHLWSNIAGSAAPDE